MRLLIGIAAGIILGFSVIYLKSVFEKPDPLPLSDQSQWLESFCVATWDPWHSGPVTVMASRIDGEFPLRAREQDGALLGATFDVLLTVTIAKDGYALLGERAVITKSEDGKLQDLYLPWSAIDEMAFAIRPYKDGKRLPSVGGQSLKALRDSTLSYAGVLVRLPKSEDSSCLNKDRTGFLSRSDIR